MERDILTAFTPFYKKPVSMGGCVPSRTVSTNKYNIYYIYYILTVLRLFANRNYAAHTYGFLRKGSRAVSMAPRPHPSVYRTTEQVGQNGQPNPPPSLCAALKRRVVMRVPKANVGVMITRLSGLATGGSPHAVLRGLLLGAIVALDENTAEKAAWRVADAGLLLRQILEEAGYRTLAGLDHPTDMGALLPKFEKPGEGNGA